MSNNQAEKDRREEFADELAMTYAQTLPSAVADHAFRLAWEHGHANGEHDVESYYVDFIDLATTAYNAPRSTR